MYCKSIFDRKIVRIETKVQSEFAILHALNLISDVLPVRIDQLISKCRLQELVTARILFSSLAFEFGARNIEIALFLQRKQPTITYFLQQNNNRNRFDKNYKDLKDKINIKQNNNMSIIDEIAAKAASTAVAEMTKLFIEQGIIKKPEIKENPAEKTDLENTVNNKGVAEFLAHQSGGNKHLGGKELDIYSTSGKKAFKISPADQLK